MASTASPEASEIRRRGRRRLIGAIALVMLLVVFVPMVLDSEPRPPRNEPNAMIPPRDTAPPLPAPPAAAPAKDPAPAKIRQAVAPAKAVAPAQAVAPAKAGAQPAPPKAAVLEAPKPASPAKPGAPAAKPADAPKLQGFAVQVGAFREEDMLRQSREKLAAAGVPHYTERLDAKEGALTRLRAGPFATRAQAEAALAKLKRAAIDGNVVALP